MSTLHVRLQYASRGRSHINKHILHGSISTNIHLYNKHILDTGLERETFLDIESILGTELKQFLRENIQRRWLDLDCSE